MTNAEESTHPEFWNNRYASGKTPWDFHGVPSALQAFLARVESRGRVLIPGCGSGYEVQAFHDAGFEVTAIDFSPAAVERAHDNLGSLSGKVLLSDFFQHQFPDRFDLIYERTFLCSLPPTRWRAYARRMAELLVPEGKLIGIFLYGEEPDPPPFPLTDGHAKELFRDNFSLIRSEPVSDSLPFFQNMERWQEWGRRSG